MVLIYLIITLVVILLLMSNMNKSYFNLINLPKKLNQVPLIETDCRFQAKKCPFGNPCDCSKFCGTTDAKLFIRNYEYFCYVSHINSSCKQTYGTYIFDEDNNMWKCVPKFPGIFTVTGKQIIGTYPHSETFNKIKYNPDTDEISIIDQNELHDEYGNKLLKIILKSGLFFYVKDYCLNNIQRNPARGYNHETGLCECTNGTVHMIRNDYSSPCVRKNLKQPESPFSIKINCYQEHFYIKDLPNYLLKCPDSSSDYISSQKQNIKIVEIKYD